MTRRRERKEKKGIWASHGFGLVFHWASLFHYVHVMKCDCLDALGSELGFDPNMRIINDSFIILTKVKSL